MSDTRKAILAIVLSFAMPAFIVGAPMAARAAHIGNGSSTIQIQGK